MESRTSPGKKGSVQPISECLTDAICDYSWVYTLASMAGDGSPFVEAGV
jgi:hypothetical protein